MICHISDPIRALKGVLTQSGHVQLEINYHIFGLRVKFDTHSTTAAFTLFDNFKSVFCLHRNTGSNRNRAVKKSNLIY